MFVKEIVVTGDRGIDYRIDWDAQQNPRCSCPAFSNRADPRTVCKHIEYIAERWLKKPRAPKKTKVRA